MVRLAAFPKCWLDDIIVHRTMPLARWISLAAELGVDGLEMHDLFFEREDDVDAVRDQCAGPASRSP